MCPWRFNVVCIWVIAWACFFQAIDVIKKFFSPLYLYTKAISDDYNILISMVKPRWYLLWWWHSIRNGNCRFFIVKIFWTKLLNHLDSGTCGWNNVVEYIVGSVFWNWRVAMKVAFCFGWVSLFVYLLFLWLCVSQLQLGLHINGKATLWSF